MAGERHAAHGHPSYPRIYLDRAPIACIGLREPARRAQGPAHRAASHSARPARNGGAPAPRAPKSSAALRSRPARSKPAPARASSGSPHAPTASSAASRGRHQAASPAACGARPCDVHATGTRHPAPVRLLGAPPLDPGAPHAAQLHAGECTAAPCGCTRCRRLPSASTSQAARCAWPQQRPAQTQVALHCTMRVPEAVCGRVSARLGCRSALKRRGDGGLQAGRGAVRGLQQRFQQQRAARARAERVLHGCAVLRQGW